MPGKLWKLLKKHLPKEAKIRRPGRPRVSNRDVLDGIWHVLWTGCQWKSIEKEWFNVSSSVLHERFQTSQSQGLFELLFKKMGKYYGHLMPEMQQEVADLVDELITPVAVDIAHDCTRQEIPSF